MGFAEMRLIAASTAGASAADPASTTTTPSSPICTPMFAPAPVITKKEGRTSRISRLFDGAAAAACDAAAFTGSRLLPRPRESAVQTATTAATRTRRHQSVNVIVIIRRTVPRRLTHNLGGQQELAQEIAPLVWTTCPSANWIFRLPASAS